MVRAVDPVGHLPEAGVEEAEAAALTPTPGLEGRAGSARAEEVPLREMVRPGWQAQAGRADSGLVLAARRGLEAAGVPHWAGRSLCGKAERSGSSMDRSAAAA